MPTIDQFDYPLPHHLIAQKPAEPRDSSKLLVVNRETGEMSHHHFYDLPKLLTENDVIVRNNTKVIPARILGQKNTSGQVELLLIKRLRLDENNNEIWECLTKPGLKPGQVVIFANSPLLATCTAITNYTREITFNLAHAALFEELTTIGHTPIPPYITEWSDSDEPKLRQLYQTTFAKVQGSAAAPTAGLHFTPEIDQRLTAKGVQIEEITLHVGLGTFLSVKDNDITKHNMHSEWFTLPEAIAERLNKAKLQGKRIIAVGTTSTRVLETCADDQGQLQPQTGETQLYVYPPRKFKFVDAMLTNFHEPKTTLIMLVSAFSSAPNTAHQFSTFLETSVGKAYLAAMENNYRFLSFGDAMIIS